MDEIDKMVFIFYFVYSGHFDHLELSKWLEMDHPNSLKDIYKNVKRYPKKICVHENCKI